MSKIYRKDLPHDEVLRRIVWVVCGVIVVIMILPYQQVYASSEILTIPVVLNLQCVSTIKSIPETDTTALPFVIYNGSKYGIQLSYPENWDVEEEVSELVSFMPPPSITTGLPEAFFSIVGITYSQGRPHFEDFTIEQFKDYMTQSTKILNEYQIPIPNYQIVEEARTTTGKGYSAFKLEYVINEPEPFDPSKVYQFNRLQIWIPSTNNLYRLQYEAEPSRYSVFLPIVEKMISSFEITNETKNLSLYTPKPPGYQDLKQKLDEDNSKVYIASSRSMEPFLYLDDMFLVSNSTTSNDLMVCDVIVFKEPRDPSGTIVARIITIGFDDSGEQVIVTKGDANPESYLGTDFPIKEENYIGKVTSVITNVQK